MPRPIRRSAARAPGSAAQPTSWPWVSATARRMPARRRSPAASSPSGAAAPNQTRVAAVRAGQLARPAGRPPGVGSSTRVALPDHLERLLGVELRRRPRQLGGVDHHRAGRLADRQVVHEGLDAAGPGREVVGDQQGTAHRPASRAYARAAAIRSTVDGCDGRPEVLPAGRVGVGQVDRRRAGAASPRRWPGRRSAPARARRPAPRPGATPAPAPGRRPARRPSTSGEQQRERPRLGDRVDAGPPQQRRPASRAGRARRPRRRRPARRVTRAGPARRRSLA